MHEEHDHPRISENFPLLALGAPWTPFWEGLGASWTHLARLGHRLGASWALFGSSWAPLGRLLGASCASWAPLGRLLGASWASLRRCWALLGASWGSWAPLGSLLGASGAIWDRFWEGLGGVGSGPQNNCLLVLIQQGFHSTQNAGHRGVNFQASAFQVQ